MKTLYISSAETFSGKSALCIGLGLRLKKDGLKAGYMKPVNVDCQLQDGIPFDEDVAFAKLTFGMDEPFDLISPVALTPAKLAQQLRGPETDFLPKLKEAFEKVSIGRDVMVLEGGRSLREGYVAGLPPKRVAEQLGAQIVTMHKFDEALMVDRAMTAQNYFGDLLIGLVINEVPKAHVEFVAEAVVPFLKRHGMNVLGVLPQERLLSAPSVRELSEGLGAEILCAQECYDELVEHMLVGAMSADMALTYFRRKPNKAVITGGDRTDIQLAALETSTRCLILTGNLYPSPQVLNVAEEQCVPVVLTKLDTLATIQVIEGFFGRSRFQQPKKIARFTEMLDANFDFGALYKAMGIEPK